MNSRPPQFPPPDWPTEPPTRPLITPSPPGPVDRPEESAAAVKPKRVTAWVVTAAVVTVVAVVAAFFAGTRVGERAASTASPTASPAPTTVPSTSPSQPPSSGSSSTSSVDPDTVRAEVAKLSTFVEERRGLRFREPVSVDVLASDEFRARVLAEFDKELETLKAQGDLLLALGMVPADLDVVDAQRRLLGDGVLGFYDPVTKALVVRADRITPFFRQILVHELTHALDDQHFDLDRPELADRHDGTDWSFLALVEGNARRIENDYVAQLSSEDRQELQDEMWQLGMEQLNTMLSVPLILAQLLTAPYDLGDPFVRKLVASGGQQALDDAFSSPPVSSEQILHPEKYLTAEGPRTLQRPPADGAMKSEGVLGEAMTGYFLQGDELGGLGNLFGSGDLEQLMRQLLGNLGLDGSGLGDLLGTPGLGLLGRPEVNGWGGDRYVVWDDTDGSGVCVRVDWVMDSDSALAELERRVQERTAGDRAARIEKPDDQRLRLTRCS